MIIIKNKLVAFLFRAWILSVVVSMLIVTICMVFSPNCLVDEDTQGFVDDDTQEVKVRGSENCASTEADTIDEIERYSGLKLKGTYSSVDLFYGTFYIVGSAHLKDVDDFVKSNRIVDTKSDFRFSFLSRLRDLKARKLSTNPLLYKSKDISITNSWVVAVDVKSELVWFEMHYAE